MQAHTKSTPLSVAILIGKHSVSVPQGTQELIAEKLLAAGIKTGEWKALLSGFVKGTPHTPDFRVRGVEGRSLLIRVHPGGNDSCTQLRLLVPKPFEPGEVSTALTFIPSSTCEINQRIPPDEMELLDSLEGPTTAVIKSVADVLGDKTYLDLVLDAVHDRYPATFSQAGCLGAAISIFEVQFGDNDGSQIIGTLLEQKCVEPAPHEGGIGYRLTRHGLQRIGVTDRLSGDDDLALSAGLQISQLRHDAEGYLAFEMQKDEIVSEIEDHTRKLGDLKLQLQQVEVQLDKHPGKDAATKWKAAQAILNIKD